MVHVFAMFKPMSTNHLLFAENSV